MNLEKLGTTLEDVVAGLIALGGGELIGRTRLQKEIYLLDRGGADFQLPFTYYQYGPYCFEIAYGITDAEAHHRITVEERPGRHRVPYSIFRSQENAPERFGKLPAGTARGFLKQMKGVSDVVLELAATIIFLRDEWSYYDKGKIDAIKETKTRKPIKATDERIDQALTLLRNLGLWNRFESTVS